MTQDAPGGIQAQRLFEQPADSASFYSDMAQVVSTGNEVILQFYETIPGPPGADGNITVVRTRLRATVTVSVKHAANIGNLLIQRLTALGVDVRPEGEKK